MPVPNLIKYIIPAIILFILCMLISVMIGHIGDPTQRTINRTQIIYTQTAFFIDPDNKVTLNDHLRDPWLMVKDDWQHIAWSFEQHTYWLKITLTSRDPHDTQLFAHFDNPMLDELDVYQLDEHKNMIKQLALGDTRQGLTLAQRSIPTFDLTLKAQSRTDLYIRIKTTGIAKTPIKIYNHDEYGRLKEKIHLIWGIFIGICVMIALYNLVLFFAIKDTVYLFYIGYIISVLVLMGVVLGFGHYIWPIPVMAFIHKYVIASNFAIAIFSLLFALSFLRYHTHKGRLYQISRNFLILMMLLTLLSFWLPEYQAAPLFFCCLGILYFLSFTLIGYKIRLGFRWAKFYIVSWIPLICTAPIQPLMLTGKIEYTFLTSYAFLIGVLLEIILMAMALADRMRYQKEKALYNATHEIATGLPNLNQLEITLESLQAQQRKFSLCVIEISNFNSIAPYISNQETDKLVLKVVNDISAQINLDRRFIPFEHKHGHPIKVAKARDGVLAILAHRFINLQALQLQLEKMQLTINKDLTLSGLFINLDTHIGVCDHPATTTLVSHIISQSFQALAQGKRAGKEICIYAEDEHFNVAQRLTLATDLQQAIRNNQLELYHQPQINLHNNAVEGSEVLLRWQHPTLGFIPPDQFIRIAEDTGVINELSLWVIETTFKQLKELLSHGFQQHKVSINISGKDITMRGFLTKVTNLIANHDIPPHLVNLELTESVMVSDFNLLSELMKAFSNMGVNVSVDDYGTGYSSLAYISQLPFNELKIDKSFILDLVESPRNLTIVKNTIDMAKHLNLTVVAEGVESNLVEQKLRDFNCDIVQGYHYSKPLPFNDYLAWLDNYQKHVINQVY